MPLPCNFTPSSATPQPNLAIAFCAELEQLHNDLQLLLDQCPAADQMPPLVSTKKRRRARLPRKAVRVMEEWFSHVTQRPSKKAVESMSEQTGVSPKQVRTWFTNRRKRRKH